MRLSGRVVRSGLCGGLFALAVAGTSAGAAEYTLTTVADNLDSPWSVVQLPDTGFLVTQRGGQLLRLAPDGAVTRLGGVPETYVAGQGGFFDIVLHPQFETNRLVYLSYAHGTPQANGTAIARARLGEDALEEVEQILLLEPLKDTPQHYGGRMLFLPDGTLLLTTGEGFDYRDAAQDLHSELGKTLRIDADGGVPDGNPFGDGASERIWTYGHRNPQGLALDEETQVVYLHEHGPRGGDELNAIVPGNNYGWPAITYGVDYSGAQISPFTAAEGMQQPLTYWVPSIAPSGMAWYGGERFPRWRGDLFVGALVDRDVKRIDLEDGLVAGEESLFSELDARIRDVRTGRDGYLYLLTDGPQGKLVRVGPAVP
ncbi:MAG: PQQ-dependent sugar dehydrogenase [Halieaceae bacterium]|nr:PQQ-dependent sugar dehydrogenase [Halieaceae bacterium]